MRFEFRRLFNAARRGVTLVEAMTAITVIGTMSAVAVQSFGNIRNSVREGTARDILASLNRALLHFNETNWDIVLNAVNGSATDETVILRTLQWRDNTAPSPGSPYVAGNFSDTVSSSTSEFRIQWNGHAFELLTPGTAGTGLLVASEAARSSVYVYPPGYQPLRAGQNE